MELTPKQESLIIRYLREVARHMDDSAPRRTRERGLAKLRGSIDRELAGLAQGQVQDADVAAVLALFGSPAEQAEALADDVKTTEDRARQGRDDRVWLGVCAEAAERMEASPLAVRVVAVAAGVITGPLAVFLYIGLYAFFQLNGPRPLTPPVDKTRLAVRAGGALLAAVALNVLCGYAIQLIYHLHERFLNRPVPGLGEWGWALVVCVPLAALSGLPLARAWDHSLKRVWQAGLALYAMALSFGLAAMLVGIILDVVQDFTQ